MHATIQHLAKRVNYCRTDPRETLGEGIGAQQQHSAGNVFRQWFPDASRVRAQKLDLQGTNIVRRDAKVGEFADASVYRIRYAIILKQVFDHGPCSFHCGPRLGLQQHRASLMDHLTNIVEA